MVYTPLIILENKILFFELKSHLCIFTSENVALEQITLSPQFLHVIEIAAITW